MWLLAGFQQKADTILVPLGEFTWSQALRDFLAFEKGTASTYKDVYSPKLGASLMPISRELVHELWYIHVMNNI